MRKSLLAMAVMFTGVQAFAAEELYFPKDFRVCRTRTTEIDRLVVPNLTIQDERTKLGEAVDLKIVDWQTSKSFTDGANRTWYPLRGTMAKDKPEKLTGWIVKSDFGREYYLTDKGAVYTLEAPHKGPRTPGSDLIKAIQALEKAVVESQAK